MTLLVHNVSFHNNWKTALWMKHPKKSWLIGAATFHIKWVAYSAWVIVKLYFECSYWTSSNFNPNVADSCLLCGFRSRPISLCTPSPSASMIRNILLFCADFLSIFLIERSWIFFVAVHVLMLRPRVMSKRFNGLLLVFFIPHISWRLFQRWVKPQTPELFKVKALSSTGNKALPGKVGRLYQSVAPYLTIQYIMYM